MNLPEPDIIGWARRTLPAAYATVLQDVVDDARRDPDVVALLLTGSLARHDALPGTDIDLRQFRTAAGAGSFDAFVRGDVTVEQTVTTEDDARTTLLTDPMHVYAYLDGVVLYDQAEVLRRLRRTARQVFQTYRTPIGQKTAIAAALAHPEEKARVALAAGDLLKATYSLATSSWQIIEGLWAANDRPLPPNASVRAHLGDLRGPPDLQRHFTTFFLGDPVPRVETGLWLVSWIRHHLTQLD